ncbi:large terminase domain protein [Shigella flexneri K-404]|nr:DNA packaging protein gp2 domain protein [Shigella flexneri K-671]EIQ33917.1 large terminase domain protein [Shigella flexneri K-404]
MWFDEEPPYSIYGEGLTRTNKYGQFSILTFTPLMGMSDVVTKFLKNPSKSQKVVNMTIYDAEHYTDEQKEQIIASYPEHEREARARGIPTMGSGRIFQIPEETIKCQPFECPDHFYVIGGMDFGWDHPQAQVQLWWDKEADTIYVSRVWKAKEKQPFRRGEPLNHGRIKCQPHGLMMETSTRRAAVSSSKGSMQTLDL